MRAWSAKLMLRKVLRSIFQKLKDMLKSSQYVQSSFYEMDNIKEFSNLYEHEKMLADSVRMNSYHEAIKRQIKPGDVVVDLGTGTGILSFMAAQQKPKKIFAIDHSDFIHVARQIADQNGIGNIEFVCTNSRDFRPNEKIDVILHEQMGDFLFNENMIGNILDLKKRLLKTTGRILPSQFELYLEPVCLKDDHKVPFFWENNPCGIDYGFLKNSKDLDQYKRDNYKRRSLENKSIDYFLCKPDAILKFDLNELDLGSSGCK